MATITINAATAGVAQAVTRKSKADSKLQVAEVFVTPSGTYDQSASESIEITNVATCIQNSRRNGKTVTLKGACPGQSAFSSSGNKHWQFETALLNSAIVDATIFENGGSEHADAALPTDFNQPMSVLVAFEEA